MSRDSEKTRNGNRMRGKHERKKKKDWMSYKTGKEQTYKGINMGRIRGMNR